VYLFFYKLIPSGRERERIEERIGGRKPL